MQETEALSQGAVKGRQTSCPPPGESHQEAAQFPTGQFAGDWHPPPFEVKGLNRRLRRVKGKTGAIFPREEHILPYKDPEERRRYDREYKRRLRAQQGLTQPSQTRVRKAYICLKFPQLRLPGIVFPMAG